MKHESTLSFPARIAESYTLQSFSYRSSYYVAIAFGALAIAAVALGIAGQKIWYAFSAIWALLGLAWCMRGAYTELILKNYRDIKPIEPIDR